MHIHILGICGTFMGGLARLAAACGHRVTGADADIYPPMSEQLRDAGIALVEGWDPAQLEPAPDCVVIGNALSRGNPVVEAVLERELPYTSGPAWLGEQVLRGRHVLAVAGTHGKTTTASMLAAILEADGREPGFLIGGVPRDFGVSARLGRGRAFVIEADEYDTAFFDKRSKFVHYPARTLVLNNLEFDHADIFPDLAAIQRQFHHWIRTVAPSARILVNADDDALADVLAAGCWSTVAQFAPPGSARDAPWRAVADEAGSHFRVEGPDGARGETDWPLVGRHNVTNGLAAVAAAAHVGVDCEVATQALSGFGGVARRLEERARGNGIVLYDDFAHHPTAIATTLAGLRARVGAGRLIAALDLASNSMRQGVHCARLGEALAAADRVLIHASGDLGWDPRAVATIGIIDVHHDADVLAQCLTAELRCGDHVVLMSNGGFGGLPAKLAAWIGSDGGGERDAG